MSQCIEEDQGEGRTKVYSTAAYYVAAVVAILLGLCPKFGAIVSATPGGVLGGITVVLYGMIGLVGAKIWVENGVDFGDPVNMVGLAGGLIAGIGGVSLSFGSDSEPSGIALGTIMVIVFFHLVNGRGSAGSGQVTQALSHRETAAGAVAEPSLGDRPGVM
jgi:xanthine/uracil permease